MVGRGSLSGQGRGQHSSKGSNKGGRGSGRGAGTLGSRPLVPPTKVLQGAIPSLAARPLAPSVPPTKVLQGSIPSLVDEHATLANNISNPNTTPSSSQTSTAGVPYSNINEDINNESDNEPLPPNEDVPSILTALTGKVADEMCYCHGKTKITISDDKKHFLGSTAPARSYRKLVVNRSTKFWPKWSSIDKNVKEGWWDEFQSHYTSLVGSQASQASTSTSSNTHAELSDENLQEIPPENIPWCGKHWSAAVGGVKRGHRVYGFGGDASIFEAGASPDEIDKGSSSPSSHPMTRDDAIHTMAANPIFSDIIAETVAGKVSEAVAEVSQTIDGKLMDLVRRIAVAMGDTPTTTEMLVGALRQVQGQNGTSCETSPFSPPSS